jgi:alcohol dehydrogenase
MGGSYGVWGGALSDAVRVPFANHMLVRLPVGVRPEAAASASDNMSDAWRAVGPFLDATPGADVLVVLGGGRAKSIALYAAGMAVALGSKRVCFVDNDKERLELAATFGAEAVDLNEPPRSFGSFPIIVDASTQQAWLAAALRSSAPFGSCTACGMYFGDIAVPFVEMYNRGVHLTVAPTNHRTVLPHVLELLATKAFDPTPMHTVVPWHEAPTRLLDPPIKLVATRL